MALIKCSECGKEVSDKEKYCPNCGIELELNETEQEITIKRKQLLKNISSKKLKAKGKLGVSLIVLGVISIIWGLSLNYVGFTDSSKSYGGDAYTGIQNSTSKTANNVARLGYVVCSGLKCITIVSGGSLIAFGVYFIIKNK